MDAGAKNKNNSDKVEAVFADFKGRYAALIKALTTDFDEFFNKCDPAAEKNLCIYGFPNETWDVTSHTEEDPFKNPRPVMGLNLVRDDMPTKEWRSLVATHCYSWLIYVAFSYGAYIGLKKSDRLSLFHRINDLLSILETVEDDGAPEKRTNKKSSVSNRMSNDGKSISHAKRGCTTSNKEGEEEEGGYDKQVNENMCGICKGEYMYNDRQFWIRCDVCKKTWFHGKCVNITLKEAKIKKYKCASCDKRPQP